MKSSIINSGEVFCLLRVQSRRRNPSKQLSVKIPKRRFRRKPLVTKTRENACVNGFMFTKCKGRNKEKLHRITSLSVICIYLKDVKLNVVRLFAIVHGKLHPL